jgi:hypothetical protein
MVSKTALWIHEIHTIAICKDRKETSNRRWPFQVGYSYHTDAEFGKSRIALLASQSLCQIKCPVKVARSWSAVFLEVSSECAS